LLFGFVGEFASQEVTAKPVHNGKLSAEKSEMPGFIKPQFAIPQSQGAQGPTTGGSMKSSLTITWLNSL